MTRLLVQRIWLMLNSFSFKSLEFWHMLSKGCLCDQHLIKTKAAEFLMSFPGRQKHVFTFHHWKNEACSMWLHLEKTLAPGFPQTLPHIPFPFADIALYPLKAITLSCEYKYMLNLWGLANYQIWGWSWKPRTHPGN